MRELSLLVAHAQIFLVCLSPNRDTRILFHPLERFCRYFRWSYQPRQALETNIIIRKTKYIWTIAKEVEHTR
jgi:hypothetical protein